MGSLNAISKIRRTGLAVILCLPYIAMAETGSTASSLVNTSSQHSGNQTTAGANVDNSGVNATQKGSAGLNAGDQSSGTADMEITRQIRRALTSNHDLSTYAQNIKIITINGVVTLKGPVKSAAEKQNAFKVANGIAGVTKIQNEITIKQ